MTKTNGVKELDITVNGQEVGSLARRAQFEFTYRDQTNEDLAVSTVMPVRVDAYRSGALHPIFEMNLPEGYLRQRIFERFRKHYNVNEMFLLALQGEHGIGRLGYKSDLIGDRPDGGVDLEEILNSTQSAALFENLIERFITSTTIAGVQPKVIVPEASKLGKTKVDLPNLIVKSAGDEFPGLAINEYVCMSMVRDVGLSVPEFYLSDDLELFVMRRFDLDLQGVPIGMEDFCVLTNKVADKKYNSTYEEVAKAIAMFSNNVVDDLSSYFKSLCMSIILGNGDAHLKNFSMLYESPIGDLSLSPWYDIVNTTVYIHNDPMALKLRGTKEYPHRTGMVQFGANHCRLTEKQAGLMIDECIEAVTSGLERYDQLISLVTFEDQAGKRNLRSEIEKGLQRLELPHKAGVKIPTQRAPKRVR